MTSKLPWTTAAILIVAAVAVGTWAVFGVPPAEEEEQPPTPPSPGYASITGTLGPATVFGAAKENSCIENIYIVAHGTSVADNLSGCENTISSSGGSVSIAWDTSFDIVVAVTCHDDNMGQLLVTYMCVELTGATDSGDWSISVENSTTSTETIFETSAGNYIRVNAVWDNNNNGYQLKADDNLTLDPIKLFCRG